MSLIDLWLTSQEQIRAKRLQQIIAFAGEGKLRDVGAASTEFRDFLDRIPGDVLSRYASECLSDSFADSGQALQDIVNQVGRRLGLDVTYGRYRGTTAHVGHDGLWRLPQGHSVIVEVKTTDAYRIDLNTLADYRKALVAAGTISEGASSMLVIVGRQDTGDLEAQIRGSRHAWDIRLISVDALLRLMAVKEDLEDPQIVDRIHQILIPREFTRLDEIVDMLFSTAEDLKQEVEPAGPEEADVERESHEKKFTPVAFHQACVERIEKRLGRTFIKRSRATFSTPEGDVRLLCAVSREHLRGSQSFFWFAFHPHQQNFLAGARESHLAFGCASPSNLLLIPFGDFAPWLDGLNVTDLGERRYWHVHIAQEGATFRLPRKAGHAPIDVTRYFIG